MKIKQQRRRTKRAVDEMGIRGISSSLSDRVIAVEEGDGACGPQQDTR